MLIALYLLYFAVMLVISFIRSTISAPEYIIYDTVSSAAIVVVFMLLPAIVEIVLFRYIIRGYACDYTANRVEFCITRKGRTVMNILYKDAVSVEYRPMKFLWAEQGFHVTIKMKSYSLFFDYVVPRAMRFHTDNFPFEIIIREIVRRKIGEQDVS